MKEGVQELQESGVAEWEGSFRSIVLVLVLVLVLVFEL
jgi:hypothetical protein